MAPARDVIIIGGGHNALVAAFYLAKAGHRPLVLERREQVGGAAITEEFAPGFRCSTLAHATGPLLPEIVSDMHLEQHGVQMLAPEPNVLALAPRGRALRFFSDPHKTAHEIAAFSQHDAAKYPEFQRTLARLGAALAQLLRLTPPALNGRPPLQEALKLLNTGRKLKKLGEKDIFRLLRWGPMAVADLVAEWFETELVRATIAARGIFGCALGPWSAGSGAVLLLRAAADPLPAGSTVFPKGGMGALTQAMAAAAQAAGAEIRANCDVARILTKDGSANGVVLAGGEEITAGAVVSGADPRRTLLQLLDPSQLEPDFALKLRNFRSQGVSAKLNLALSALPSFSALKPGDANSLAGRIHIGPEIDYLERAFDASKYGEFSREPYLDVTIPSLSDPSLAPAGKHVMSVYIQFAPHKLKQGSWSEQGPALAEAAIKTLAQHAPDLPQRILHKQMITPAELERDYSLTGGHIFHGELALDQLFTMRPLLGWARYQTPVRNLYLCGSGTHPGAGLTGASGVNAAREIAKGLRR